MIAPLFGSITRPILSPLVSGLRDELFGGFNPRNLFAANEPGYLYDLDDLSTVFLDSAGTTPATVNGLVGLQLDKSQGLALGAELVTNGDFSGGSTGWFVRPLWAVSGGSATATGASDSFQQVATPYTAGKWYRVEFDWTHTGGILYVRLGTGPAATFTTSGRKVVYLLAVNTAGIEFYGGATSGTLDNISVREIQGNHRYQSATGSKPILRGTPTGANLASGASWTAGTGWSIAGDTATATTSSGTLSALAAEVGKFYRVTYTITRTAGSIQPTLGGRTGTARSASGTYVQYFDNAISTAALVFTGTGFTGTVTLNTIEAVDISAGSVSAPYALQYDGVDDFLQTAAVDFTATDKVTVCHGVRKLSDAAVAIVVELSASATTNSGSFWIIAPSDNGLRDYGFRAGGTLRPAIASAAIFTSPVTSVISMQSDIANDSLVGRVNGLQAAQSTGDQGTGYYGNYPLYFGRRGGASIPYNGLKYSSVCIGRLLTAAELANVERWVARKTGVTL